MNKLAFFGLLFCAQMVFASSLIETDKGATLNGITLKLSSGIREKKILFFGVDVYRATLFVSDDSFSHDTKGTVALDSLKSMKAYALKLELLRSLSADKIVGGFETALKENNVKDSPAIAKFKKTVKDGGDVESGGVVKISVDTKKGVLICEQGKKIVEIRGDSQFFRDIFSIWLGKPADSGIAALREELIKGA